MADRKISDLTALTAPAAGDYLPIVDISEVSAANKNKRITIEELLRGAPDGTAAAPSIGFESDPNTGIYRPGADQLAISTGGSGKLFVNNAGEVDISSANARLYITTTGTNTAVATLRNASYYYNINLDGTNGALTFYNGTERLRIDSSGRLLVNTSTNTGGALLQVNDNRIRIATAKTPASATDTGSAGEICWDTSYIYVCTATNTWKRAALSTW